jgi:putative ABC transport system permease protein
MWRITLKGIVAHRLRYALTALAVLLGVAFISGTFVLTDTMNSTFNNLWSQIYQGTAAVVRASQSFNPGTNWTNDRQLIDSSLTSTVAKVPGVQAVAVDIEGYARIVGKDGKPLGVASNGPPTLGVAWTDVTALNPLRLQPGGQQPRGPHQVVIDKHSADAGGFAIGDKVRILTQQGSGIYTISGLAKWGSADSPLGATLAAFDPVTAAKVLLGQPGKANAINVEATPGVSADTLVTRISSSIHTPGIQVVSGASITQEGQQTTRQAMSFVGDFLLAFGFIALFVGAFVIFNTFAIVVAQRQRELALLRAVGASRRQVLAAVVGESMIVGLLASAVGVAAGIGLAVLLKAALSALGYDLPASGLVVSSRTVLFGLLVGILVTVASAIVPARRAATIAPVAALQDAAAESRQPSPRRSARRLIVAAAGVAALCTGLFGHTGYNVPLVGIGAATVFIGVAMLSPLIVRPVCRVLGVPVARAATSGTLGQRSAVRNPSRTSATAAALMVGVALVSMITVMASSVKSSADSVINSALRADFVVSSGAQAGGASGLSPGLERSLAALPQVSTVAGIRSGVVKVFGTVLPVVAEDPAKTERLFDIGVTQGNMAAMTPAGIGVSTQVAFSQHLRLGSTVAVTYPTTGTKNYVVQFVYKVRNLGGDYILPLAAGEANLASSLDVAIFLKLAPGVTANAARPAIDRVLAAYPDATLQDQAQYQASYTQSVNSLLNLVYVLLLLSLLIALIGIANTLALSIYERTRELGLLRAVGMTRGQLRSMVRAEALVISMFGALEGLVLGALFGWAIVAAMHSSGVTQLVFPVSQMLIVAVVAALAGVLAAIAPSRRAAKLNVLEAVTTE